MILDNRSGAIYKGPYAVSSNSPNLMYTHMPSSIVTSSAMQQLKKMDHRSSLGMLEPVSVN